MPTIWTYLRAGAVAIGSSTALLTGAIAHADPVPAPPVPNLPQQLIASAANAPQILQNLATALGATPPPAPVTAPGISATIPGLSPAAAPTAPATGLGSLTTVPGLTAPTATAPTTGLGSLATVPGLTAPASTAPAAPAATSPLNSLLSVIPGLGSTLAPAASGASSAATQSLIPQTRVDMPAVPGMQVPSQVHLPGDLTSLANGVLPGSTAGQVPGTPSAGSPAAVTHLPPTSLLSAIP